MTKRGAAQRIKKKEMNRYFPKSSSSQALLQQDKGEWILTEGREAGSD